MKGISTIIATILMLMITIALAGTAYLYISGAFTQELQGINIVDSFCTQGNVTLTLRNTGTETISSISCIQTSPANDNGPPCTSTSSTLNLVINPGSTNSTVDICSGSGARSCIYRLTPPTGRSQVATVTCAS